MHPQDTADRTSKCKSSQFKVICAYTFNNCVETILKKPLKPLKSCPFYVQCGKSTVKFQSNMTLWIIYILTILGFEVLSNI